MIAAWIAAKLNDSPGPVRLLLPEGGVSALDAPGQSFHDPDANAALFASFKRNYVETDIHKLVSVPQYINDEAFAAVVEREIRSLIRHRCFDRPAAAELEVQPSSRLTCAQTTRQPSGVRIQV